MRCKTTVLWFLLESLQFCDLLWIVLNRSFYFLQMRRSDILLPANPDQQSAEIWVRYPWFISVGKWSFGPTLSWNEEIILQIWINMVSLQKSMWTSHNFWFAFKQILYCLVKTKKPKQFVFKFNISPARPKNPPRGRSQKPIAHRRGPLKRGCRTRKWRSLFQKMLDMDLWTLDIACICFDLILYAFMFLLFMAPTIVVVFCYCCCFCCC